MQLIIDEKQHSKYCKSQGVFIVLTRLYGII